MGEFGKGEIPARFAIYENVRKMVVGRLLPDFLKRYEELIGYEPDIQKVFIPFERKPRKLELEATGSDEAWLVDIASQRLDRQGDKLNSNVSDERDYLTIGMYLYKDGEKHIAEGDVRAPVDEDDDNYYEVLLGREMPPMIVHSGVHLPTGFITAEGLAEAKKHMLTDNDCVAIMDMLATTTAEDLQYIEGAFAEKPEAT